MGTGGQALDQPLRHIRQKLWAESHELTEEWGIDAKQFGVSYCGHLGHRRFAGEHRHFSDGLAGMHLTDDSLRAIGLFEEDGEPARNEHEQGAIIFSASLQ